MLRWVLYGLLWHLAISTCCFIATCSPHITFIVDSSLLVVPEQDLRPALSLAHQAAAALQAGQVDTAIALLRKAIALEPNNHTLTYQLAYAHYFNKDGKIATNLLRKYIKRHKKVATTDAYVLLARCYLLQDQRDKAKKTLQLGLKRHPKAGQLYNELGGIAYQNGRNDIAIRHWEKGIKVAPTFASNYYWTAQLFSHSTERIWGVIYGELFLHLQGSHKRTEQMQQLLLQTYIHALQPNEDSSAYIATFSRRANMYLLLEAPIAIYEQYTDSTNSAIEQNLPFQVAFEQAFNNQQVQYFAKQPIKTIYLMRSAFLRNWQRNSYDQQYPNLLIDWLIELQDAHLLEPYTYWLLKSASKQEFEQYWLTNYDQLRALHRYMDKYPLELGPSSKFYRQQYAQ